MNIITARRFISDALKKSGGNENAAGEADLILIRLLRVQRPFILAHPEKELTDGEQAAIKQIIARRVTGEPLQYILGEAYFWGLPFKVGTGVLVPRPDTEFLVEAALKHLPVDRPSLFLDWGTGSGCIAAALLTERPKAAAVMAEKNPRSIAWAWKNLKNHNLHGRTLLLHSREPEDIPVKKNSLDLIVSNPPYIPTDRIAGLTREVRDHEPRMALDGGADGMDFYEKLFAFAPLLLKEGGVLAFEIGGAEQAEKIREKIRKMAGEKFALLEEIPDLSGQLRCMVCSLSSV